MHFKIKNYCITVQYIMRRSRSYPVRKYYQTMSYVLILHKHVIVSVIDIIYI